MPDSMYDKLGDLLNDALESGEIPKKSNENFTGCESSGEFRDNSTLFSFPPNIVEALNILEIKDYSKISKPYIRKIYSAQIKKVHPDTNTTGTDQNQEVLKIIQAYKTLTEYFI